MVAAFRMCMRIMVSVCWIVRPLTVCERMFETQRIWTDGEKGKDSF